MSSVVQNIRLEQIRTDGGTQPRAEVNEDVVREYAESLTDGAKMPPVVVFYDGAGYWLADGFHRFFAHRKIGALDIAADVRQGTRRDAVLHSVGANDTHGLRRSKADKRQAVLTLLKDDEWGKWSNREIARRCSVNDKTVAAIRESLTAEIRSDEPGQRTYTTKHGTEAVMNTTNIGKKKKVTPAKEPAHTFEQAPLPDEVMDASDELAEAHHTITELAEENEKLRDQLAVQLMDGSEAEKIHAASTIADLRRRVKALEEENATLKVSRDTYMQKCAEMQKQINYWRREAEKRAAA